MIHSFIKALIVPIFILFVYPASGQSGRKIPSEKPKLVLGIVVDQLRYDYIEKFREKFENDGIMRMVQSGSFCKNATYDYLINETSTGYATIATGALPSSHGIISNNWYNNLTEQVVYCVGDEKANSVGGSYESGRFSPAKLMATTIGDEIRLSTNFKSKVIGIAMENSAAILSSGHSANYSFWYDDKTGKWVSSDYYIDSLPQWAEEFNNKGLADYYLGRVWSPLLPLKEYFESSSDTINFEKGIGGRSVFPYDLNKISMANRDKRDYSLLKYTPFGNVLTRDFATAAIMNEEIGQDEYTDYVVVGFSANEYIGKSFGPASVEMEDAVLRLDREIAYLLDFIDEFVGLHNTLIYFTSDHGLAYRPEYLKEHRIPSGTFSPNSALSLLGSYLNLIYGKGDWIKYYYAQQVYLNHDLADHSRIPLEEIQDRVAQFLLQFEGVANAVTSYTLQTADFSDGNFYKMQNGYHQKRSGDVILNLAPGWVEKEDLSASYHSSYLGDNHVPLIWYGWKIKRSSLVRPVKMTDIAPTISYFLDISKPNVSSGEIILELVD